MRAYAYAETKSIALEDVPIPDPGRARFWSRSRFAHLSFRSQPHQQDVPRHSDPSSPRATGVGNRRKAWAGVTGWSEAIAWWSPQTVCLQCVNCGHGDSANCLRIQLMAFP